MHDFGAIRAISLDLDDTLWPIWPTIRRAEASLQAWLRQHAPRTAELYAQPGVPAEIRAHVTEVLVKARPELAHDMSAMRLESIRWAMQRAGDTPTLAEAAFEVFFEARQQVDLYGDVPDALARLARRFPLVAISNGNADVARVGVGHHFSHALSARDVGFGKPDPRIFHAAAARLQLAPAEILHIGDDVDLDAVGALDAGMHALWLNRSGASWPHAERACGSVTGLDQACDLLGA